VELTIAIILEQGYKPILVLVKGKWQLLGKHPHHVECCRLLVQTVGPDVHALVLGILLVLLHQVVLPALVVVLLVLDDDVVNLG
jgi:hypothetical protein